MCFTLPLIISITHSLRAAWIHYLASVDERLPLPAMPVRQLHSDGQVTAVEGNVEAATGATQSEGDQSRGFRPVRAACLDTVPLDGSRPDKVALPQLSPLSPACQQPTRGSGPCMPPCGCTHPHEAA